MLRARTPTLTAQTEAFPAAAVSMHLKDAFLQTAVPSSPEMKPKRPDILCRLAESSGKLLPIFCIIAVRERTKAVLSGVKTPPSRDEAEISRSDAAWPDRTAARMETMAALTA